MSRYISAREAADALGVAVPTIYAYVSRGLIRSEETEGSNRQHRYYAEDIERLLTNKEAARNPEKIAGEALHWGTPLLESELTLIIDDAVYYRGHNALSLARRYAFEQVAALLWSGSLDVDLRWDNHPATEDCMTLLAQMDDGNLHLLQSMQMVLPLAAAEDVTAYDMSPPGIVRSAVRILRLMVAVAIGQPPSAKPIAEALTGVWCPRQRHAAGIINAALILGADHELNASSFTARVIAGAGASPYAVVTGALSTFQGVKHGGATERAGIFLAQIDSVASARTQVADWLRRGETIPGFGHPIYPDDDPRATMLLAQIAENYGDAPALDFLDTIAGLIDRRPNIDGALAAAALTLGLSPAQATTIFALGRTAGWIAHAIEQYGGRMIRPRARYTGPQPLDE